MVELSLLLLAAATAAQLAAAFLAVRLVPLTGGRRAWALVVAAMALMVARRGLAALGLMDAEGVAGTASLAADAVTLVISLLLAAGLALLLPVARASRDSARQVQALADRLAAEGQQRRALVDALPIAVMVLRDQRIVVANRAVAEVFRLPPETAVGRALEELVVPEQRDAFRRWLANPPEDSDATERHEWEVTAGDERRWVALRRRAASWEGAPALLVTAADVTAVRTATRELEASEARFRTLTEGTASAIIIYQGTRIRYVNRAAAELTGYAPEEFAAMQFWDLVHPDHREMVRQRGLARQRGEAPPRRYQFKILRKDGEVRWIDFSADSIILDDQPAGLGTAFDITRQKQIEEELQAAKAHLEELVAQRTAELRESEERFRALAENSLDVIMRFDREFRHLYANPIVESQTGIPAADFIGKTHRELGFPEELCEVWEAAIDQVFRTGKTHRIEFQLPAGIWIDWLLIPERDADGSVGWVITAARDITERKTAEEELRRHRDRLAELVEEATAELRATNERLRREIAERARIAAELRTSEARYRSLYDNVTIGLYRTTPSGRIELANPAMVRMLGYDSFAELAERDLETVGFTEAFPRQRFKELLERDGEVIGLEYPMQRRDGTLLWVREHAKVVRGEDGTIQYYEGTVEDTTQRRALEDRLRQAEKMEALGTMAGGVAHDFNNLLMAVRGAAELLQRHLAGDEVAQRELAVIQRAATRGGELAGSLLAFARRRVLETREVDLAATVQETLQMLGRVLPENITVDFRHGGGEYIVRADPGQIQQILVNLATNARDAMPWGGTFTISLAEVVPDEEELRRLELPPGRYLRLAVTDTGVGMEAETLARAFEPFFTTKPPGSGTGLGLASVYGTVKQHGGAVRASSAPGRGTTVEVFLPASAPGTAAEPRRQPETPPGGGNETILVVEDEADVRHVLAEALAGLGYQVLLAEDGVAALEVLRQHGEEVRLVISDVVMPRLGGLELRAAAAPLAPGVRFLFSSGYSESVLPTTSEGSPSDDFLAKPYGIDELARKVREILDRPGG